MRIILRSIPNAGPLRAKRKKLLAQMTTEQSEACERDYQRHCATCAEYGMPVSDFTTFLVEWLECDAGEKSFPASSPAPGEDLRDGFRHRSYERLYERKKGFE